MTTWRCYRCGDCYNEHVRWCARCGGINTTVRLGQRPSASIDGVAEVSDAASLAALAGIPAPVPAYPTLLVGRGALVVLWGPPAGGKSTCSTRWLDSLPGPVLYASCEEGLGPTLAGRLVRSGVTRRDFGVIGRASVDQICEELRRRRAIGLVVDSVQSAAFEPSELRHILAVHPALQTLIAVCQVNAKGSPEGRRSLIHEADVAIHVEDLHASITKSRYQENTDATTHVPVLPRRGETGAEVRQAVAPVRRLHLVPGEDVLPRNGEHRRPVAPLAGRSGAREEDRDRPGRVEAAPDDANDRGGSPPSGDHVA